MKKFYLMRHAKSSWSDPTLADHDRPLNKRGKQSAATMGELMRDLDISPGAVFCSTAKRARQTLIILLETWPIDCPVKYLEQLYHAGIGTFIDILSCVPHSIDQVMFIGHNPDIELFIEAICESYETIPTAAIAEIILQVETWSEITDEIEGELRNIWRPRDIDI